MDSFKVYMNPLGKRAVEFKVDIYYNTEAVMRFRLSGGDKIMDLEKRLLQKTNKWKVLSSNFKFENVGEHTTRNLFELFKILDEQISGNPRNTFKNPGERKSNF